MVGMTDDSPYLPDSPPPQTRRSAETWAAARADYLAGGSAAEVCERHSLSLSTFRWRAQQEGWRKMDQPLAAPFHVTDDPGDYRNWTPAPAPTDDADDADALADSHTAPADAAPCVSFSQADEYEDSLPAAADLCEQAWYNAARAIRHGRMIEARGWTRLHKELAAIAHDRDGDRMRRLNDRIGRNLADLKASIGAMRTAPKDL
jgi:hypothetical protein